MKSKGSLLNKVFLLSMANIVFFIGIWAYYFKVRLIPLGLDAEVIYYQEILPGLMAQGLAFAILFRIVYSKVLGKRMQSLLDYLQACINGGEDAGEDLAGADEVARVGEQVKVLLNFLTNTFGALQEKTAYFKSSILNLMNTAGKTDQGLTEVLEHIQDTNGKLTSMANNFSDWEKETYPAVQLKVTGADLAASRQGLVRLLEVGNRVEGLVDENTEAKLKQSYFEKLQEIEGLVYQLTAVKEIECEAGQLCESIIQLREQTEQLFDQTGVKQIKRILAVLSSDSEHYALASAVTDRYMALTNAIEEIINCLSEDIEMALKSNHQAGVSIEPLEGISLRGDANRLLQSVTNLEAIYQQRSGAYFG